MQIESDDALRQVRAHLADLERQLERLTAPPRSYYMTENQLAMHVGEVIRHREAIEAYERREDSTGGSGELAGEGAGEL